MQEENYTTKLLELQKEESNIRKRLEEIKENNNRYREEQQKIAINHGVSPESVEDVVVQDENGNFKRLEYIDTKNRDELTRQLNDNLEQQKLLFEARRAEKIGNEKVKQAEIKKQEKLDKAREFFRHLDTSTTKGYDISGLSDNQIIEVYNILSNHPDRTIYEKTMETMKNDYREGKTSAENIKNEISREDLLEQAYKFFTYLDTPNTTGYDVSDLTEDEVIALYNKFLNNKENPDYKRIWNETTERMKKGDRKINRPSKKENNDHQNQELADSSEHLKKPDDFGPLTPEPLKENNNQENNFKETDSSLESEEPFIKGEEKNKNKLPKFKEWFKKNQRKLIIGGLVVGGVLVTGSIVVGLVATGVLNTVLPYDSTNDTLSFVDKDIINDIKAPQMHDGKVILDNNDMIYASAEDVLNNNGQSPLYNEVNQVDMYDTSNGKFDNINPSNLTEEEYQNLIANGHVPLTSIDPSVSNLDGNAIAAQDKATGFTR